jgi:hypothetical protein
MHEIRDLLSSLPEIEQAIRGLIPWSVGGSRFALWASAVFFFTIVTTIPAHIFGWMCGVLADTWVKRKR